MMYYLRQTIVQGLLSLALDYERCRESVMRARDCASMAGYHSCIVDGAMRVIHMHAMRSIRTAQ